MGSLIAALLKWTGLSQAAMELIAIGIVVTGVGGVAAYEHHKIYTEGVTAALAKQKASNDADTKVLQAKADAAEHAHDSELSELQHYRDTHAVTSVSLCLDPINDLQASAAVSVSGGTVTTAPGLQSVPAGDSGVRKVAGPDIGGMLEALAGRADQVTAQARELQSGANK